MLVSVYNNNNNNKTRPGMSEAESHVSASAHADEHLKRATSTTSRVVGKICKKTVSGMVETNLFHHFKGKTRQCVQQG